MTSFKYFYETQATGQLDIEDVGNCAIIGYSVTTYVKHILIVKTVDGQTKVVMSGPHWTELEKPCVNYEYTFQTFQFSSSKIENMIDRFLNAKNYITQATCVDFEEALKHIPDVREYIIND